MSFTIIVSGTLFTLTADQINSDSSPNALTAALLLLPDPQITEYTLSTRPDVFSIIHDHLRGYPILPLDEVCSTGMGVPRMLRFLRHDAESLGLLKLVEMVDEELGEIAAERGRVEGEKKVEREREEERRLMQMTDRQSGLRIGLGVLQGVNEVAVQMGGLVEEVRGLKHAWEAKGKGKAAKEENEDD